MAHVSSETCLLRDEHRYHAHPHLAVLGSGTWLLVANRAPRRSFTMHPPQDPEFVNILMRSEDEGATWSAPAVAPAYGWTGTECAGLTPLGGASVLLNQWRFGWFNSDAVQGADGAAIAGPDELKASLAGSSEIGDDFIRDMDAARMMPWARAGGTTWAHVSHDAGRTWATSAKIATAPFSGGYGMRGGLVTGGDILLPLSDVPNWRRIFMVTSSDGGVSWGTPRLVADVEGCAFEEPSILRLRDGSLLMLARENRTRSLYSLTSRDEGQTWSSPVATNMATYPAHLLCLADGRVGAVAGKRQPPFGIELILRDEATGDWLHEEPIVVRTGLPNRDLGYPTAGVRADGSIYCVYYYRDRSGVTGLYATAVAL